MNSHSNIIPVKEIQIDNANRSFIDLELPIVLKEGAKKWTAFNKWTVNFFKEQYGSVEVPLSNYKRNPYQSAAQKESIRIDEYLTSAERISQGFNDPNEDLYSAGWFFCRANCELLKDVQLPEFFQNNWADKVQNILRFDTRSILFGHHKVESPLHTDSFFVSTFFGMIKGQKRMRLVHPKHSKHLHNGFNVYDELKVKELAEKNVEIYDCTIAEGDLVWFPPGWWHHVKNDNFTISITTNFVDAAHFLPFEQQVRSTLIRPLLNLAKLQKECSQQIAGNFSVENITNGRFLELENQYVKHFQGELERTRKLISSLS